VSVSELLTSKCSLTRDVQCIRKQCRCDAVVDLFVEKG